MGMRNIIPCDRPLATNLTYFSHDILLIYLLVLTVTRISLVEDNIVR